VTARTHSELLSEAGIIKLETTQLHNTATRVGTMLEDIIDSPAVGVASGAAPPAVGTGAVRLSHEDDIRWTDGAGNSRWAIGDDHFTFTIDGTDYLDRSFCVGYNARGLSQDDMADIKWAECFEVNYAAVVDGHVYDEWYLQWNSVGGGTTCRPLLCNYDRTSGIGSAGVHGTFLVNNTANTVIRLLIDDTTGTFNYYGSAYFFPASGGGNLLSMSSNAVTSVRWLSFFGTLFQNVNNACLALLDGANTGYVQVSLNTSDELCIGTTDANYSSVAVHAPTATKVGGPLDLPEYTVAQLLAGTPSGAVAGRIVWVTDDAAGAQMACSGGNGSGDWHRGINAAGALVAVAPPPSVSGISPPTGASATANTGIVITGDNFVDFYGNPDVISVTFGAYSATVGAVTDTTIAVTSPLLPLGTFNVTVTTSAGSATLPAAYTAQFRPFAPSLVPHSWYAGIGDTLDGQGKITSNIDQTGTSLLTWNPKPTYVASDPDFILPIADCSAGAYAICPAFTAIPQPWSIITVVKFGTGGSSACCESGQFNWGYIFGNGSTAAYASFQDAGGGTQYAIKSPINTGNLVAIIGATYNDGGKTQLYINSKTPVLSSANAATHALSGGLVVAARHTGSGPLNGKWACTLIVAGAITGEMLDYVAAMYGVTIP
jgi:hypothetical protein